MNIPPKYEDVVVQLEAALGRESEMVARANQSKLEMDAASGTIDLLEKDLSILKQKACEAAEREAALREELSNTQELAGLNAKLATVLQQRLTVAEQLAGEMSVAISSAIKAAVFHRGVVEIDTNAYHALEDALGPVEVEDNV